MLILRRGPKQNLESVRYQGNDSAKGPKEVAVDARIG